VKAVIPYLIAILLGAAICFTLMRWCGKSTPLQQSKTAVDSFDRVKRHMYDSAQRMDSPIIAYQRIEIDSFLDITNSLHASQVIMKYNMDSLKDRIGNTLAALDEARGRHDTVKVGRNCDSLEAEVKDGVPMVTGYSTLTDSIIQTHIAIEVIQDSTIAMLTRDNIAAHGVITAQDLRYQVVNADDKIKTIQLRIYKPVAIGGAAIIAAEIIYKILLK